MKRYFASGGLILASLAYVLFQRLGGADANASSLIVTPSEPTNTSVGTPQSAPPFASSTPTPAPTPSTPAPTPPPKPAKGMYRDGSYTGSVADAYYGYVQVRAIVSGGKLTNVQILQYPSDRSTSRFINSQALPYLTQEALSAQSANVDTVSGASDTSGAFRESLGSALSQAKA